MSRGIDKKGAARRALLRFDAGVLLGAGHAMRCLALARALAAEGWDCGLLVSPETLEALPGLAGSGHGVQTVAVGEPPEDWPRGPADLVILDHYGLDARVERACREVFGALVIAIDDFEDRAHDCALVVNPAPLPVRMTALGAGTAALSGGAYAPLRADFAVHRPHALARRGGLDGPLRLLVGFGLADHDDWAGLVLDALEPLPGRFEIEIMVGAAAPHLGSLRRRIAAYPHPATLALDPPDVPALMAGADLALGAAGVTALERCCLGLPAVIFEIADNQRVVAGQLHAAGAALNLGHAAGVGRDRLRDAVAGLAAIPDRLAAMGRAAALVTDGLGARRIVTWIDPERDLAGRAVILRPATPADEALILSWQSHPETRRHSRNPAIPSAAEHRAWLAQCLADPGCLLTLMLAGGEPAGVLRLDRDPDPEGGFEVSILVAPELKGQRLGAAALRIARRWLPQAMLHATVLSGNTASLRLFAGAGYRPEGSGRLISRPELPRGGPENLDRGLSVFST